MFERMITILKNNKTCIECDKKPNFNFKGQITGLYCSKHKKKDMIDILNKTCIEIGCKIRAVYNFEGEKIPLYCTTHRKDRMIDVIHKICKSEWCTIQVCNKKYEGYCLYCYMHLQLQQIQRLYEEILILT